MPPSEKRFPTIPDSKVGNSAVSFAELTALDQSDLEAKTLGGMLKGAREDIRALGESESQELTSVLLGPNTSPFIRKIIDKALAEIGEAKESVSEMSDSRRLVEAITYQRKNKRYTLPNKGFLNVLQYLAHERGDDNPVEETEVVSFYKDEYEERARRLVSQGVLPPGIVDERLYLLYKTPVTSDPRAAGDLLGYHSPLHGVVIYEEHTDGPEEKATVFHELTHAISSGAMTPDGEQVFVNGFRGSGRLERVFNEGVTELITSALLKKDSCGEHVVYAQEQNLIIALCECSEGEITPRDFIDIYFAKEGDTKNVQWLSDRLSEVYSTRLMTMIRRSAYGDSEKNLRNITMGLYRDWAKLYANEDNVEKIADRMLDAEDGRLVAGNPLCEPNDLRGRSA